MISQTTTNFTWLFTFFSTGFQVTEEQLEEVVAMSGVLEVPDDFLVLEFRKKCEKILPDLYCCQ